MSIFKNINVSRETILLVFFIAWAGVSIIWSPLQSIAIYRLLTIIEIVIFVLISAKMLIFENWLNLAKWALIFNGLIQTFIGIAQFLLNRSIGLFYLGESIIGPGVGGVAKILINGEKHIRAYGTMPHPNILAAFLLIPLFLVMDDIIKILSGVPHETPNRKRSQVWLFIILAFLLIGLLCTGSRSALMGLLIGMPILMLQRRKDLKIVWNNKNCFSLKGCPINSLLLILIAIVLVIFIVRHTSLISNQSLHERALYQKVSYETISDNFIGGVGLGQFVFHEHILYPQMESWQYQPVHNIFLLIFSELGIIGFVLFGLISLNFIYSGWGRLKTEELTYYAYYVIIISFLPLMFFDHFFWDLKIGLLIFSLPIGFLIADVKHHQINTVSSEKF